MSSIREITLPDTCLLGKYNRISGAHTDCFTVSLDTEIALHTYVQTFFSTPIFRRERMLLNLVGRRSSESDVIALANGTADTLAAWQTEDRTANELLLAVKDSPIRTWLMVQPNNGKTLLYFGSAVLPRIDAKTGKPKVDFLMNALMGFHRLYSKILLWWAKRRLER